MKSSIPGTVLCDMTIDASRRETLTDWPGVAIWGPGERHGVFRRKLGFMPSKRAFFFVGTFAEEKGVETLVSAYTRYRSDAPLPLDLVSSDTGPLQPLLENVPEIRLEGFVPPQLLQKLASATGLVLPSTFKFWAVTVCEVDTAGLPNVASEEVGASVHLVQDVYNGYISAVRDAAALADFMGRVSSLEYAWLKAMSETSNFRSKQFEPVRWADALLAYAAEGKRHSEPIH